MTQSPRYLLTCFKYGRKYEIRTLTSSDLENALIDPKINRLCPWPIPYHDAKYQPPRSFHVWKRWETDRHTQTHTQIHRQTDGANHSIVARLRQGQLSVLYWAPSSSLVEWWELLCYHINRFKNTIYFTSFWPTNVLQPLNFSILIHGTSTTPWQRAPCSTQK